MALITVPEIELDELLPVPELVPPAAPPLRWFQSPKWSPPMILCPSLLLPMNHPVPPNRLNLRFLQNRLAKRVW